MTYDAVIAGSGFGGAAAALRLAQAGKRVLIIERGGAAARDDGDWNKRRILIEQRYRTRSPLSVRQYGARGYATMQANAVLGGNSVFYGGASLRMRPGDFDRWPISYDDLEPYYCDAEELLGVHGEPGARGEPPRSRPYPFEPIELAPPAQRILDAGHRLGLHPFRIPLAINFGDDRRPRCIRCTTCDGFPCKIEAKNDVTTTLLKSALGCGIDIHTGVIVDRLVERDGRIDRLAAVDADSGRRIDYTGERYILAAGAIGTAATLLRSGFERFSDLLGRGLMRHCNAVVTGMFPFQTNRTDEFHKQICFADFYERDRSLSGCATGLIQDIYTPAAEVIRHFAPYGVKGLAGATNRFMQNLLCIAEDDAQPSNRIRLSSDGCDAHGLPTVKIDHAYSVDDIRRRDVLVAEARRILKEAGAFITRVYEIDTFSHAIGSVPCGERPETSILDRDCRFRGIDNLWVCDGSVIPGSAAVNPSLTVTANALRVADGILHFQALEPAPHSGTSG